MFYTCLICSGVVEPNDNGEIRIEGVTEAPEGKAWVWGPEVVHENCRLKLHTPFDGLNGYVATWQMMKA